MCAGLAIYIGNTFRYNRQVTRVIFYILTRHY